MRCILDNWIMFGRVVHVIENNIFHNSCEVVIIGDNKWRSGSFLYIFWRESRNGRSESFRALQTFDKWKIDSDLLMSQKGKGMMCSIRFHSPRSCLLFLTMGTIGKNVPHILIYRGLFRVQFRAFLSLGLAWIAARRVFFFHSQPSLELQDSFFCPTRKWSSEQNFAQHDERGTGVFAHKHGDPNGLWTSQ